MRARMRAHAVQHCPKFWCLDSSSCISCSSGFGLDSFTCILVWCRIVRSNSNFAKLELEHGAVRGSPKFWTQSCGAVCCLGFPFEQHFWCSQSFELNSFRAFFRGFAVSVPSVFWFVFLFVHSRSFRVGLAVSSLRPAVSSLKKFGLDPFLCIFLVLVLPSLFLQAFGLDLFSCILLGLVLLSLFLQSFLVVSQFSKSLRLNPFSCFEPAVSNLKKFWSRPFLVYFLVLVLPSLFLQVFGLDLFSCILLGLVLLSLFLQRFLVSTFFRAFFGCWFCCLRSPKNCV